MADMQKRHHRLIQDAVEKGIITAFDDPTVQRKLEPLDREKVLYAVARRLAEALADNLQFTDDNFQGEQVTEFNSTLVRHVQESLRAKRNKAAGGVPFRMQHTRLSLSKTHPDYRPGGSNQT